MAVSRRKLLPMLLIVALVMIPAAYGLGIYTKELAGMGILKITDEVTVEEIEIDDATKAKIKLASNAQTVADKSYTVKLYLDGTFNSQQTTSWTAGEISGGIKKTLTWTGLSLAGVTTLKFEVTG